jgi:hypothetical protein
VRIEIGITHEVVIKGDKSWIRLAITEDLPEGVDIEGAVDDLAEVVNAKLINVIEQTVETVTSYQ